ncbi:hypothetical protein Bbelb_119830 [Branchiostoma belcheri]|nr:hypothetical protein Bbelb_119830 [Branchiostoma belcheri]
MAHYRVGRGAESAKVNDRSARSIRSKIRTVRCECDAVQPCTSAVYPASRALQPAGCLRGTVRFAPVLRIPLGQKPTNFLCGFAAENQQLCRAEFCPFLPTFPRGDGMAGNFCTAAALLAPLAGILATLAAGTEGKTECVRGGRPEVGPRLPTVACGVRGHI